MGERRGGRQKGTPNKRTSGIFQMLKKMKCDPLVGMAKMAQGEIPCLHCNEKGELTLLAIHKMFGLKPKEELIDTMSQQFIRCPVCDGTKVEKVQQKIRADMYKELSQYIAPKRRAIEHSGTIGGSDKTPAVNVTLKNG